MVVVRGGEVLVGVQSDLTDQDDEKTFGKEGGLFRGRFGGVVGGEELVSRGDGCLFWIRGEGDHLEEEGGSSDDDKEREEGGV